MRIASNAVWSALAIGLALPGCSREPEAPLVHSLSGHVRLIGYLVHDDGTFAGTRVVDDADGVPVELTHGTQLVARALTVKGVYSVAGLAPGDYSARTFVLGAVGDSTRRMTIASQDVVAGDTLVITSFGDINPVPNPVVTSTTLYFSLAVTETVEVRVLDLNGGLVRPLFAGELLPGLRGFTWNGDDAAGHPASQRMFWATLVAGDDVRAQLLFRP